MRASLIGVLYLIAGAVVVSSERAAIEDAWRDVLGRRRRRVHWHNESEADRLRLVAQLASQPVQGICAAVESQSPRRQERAVAVQIADRDDRYVKHLPEGFVIVHEVPG